MSTTSPTTTTPLASFNGPHTFELSNIEGISQTELRFEVVKFHYIDQRGERNVVDLTNEAGRKQFDAIRASYPGQYLGIIFDNTSQSQPPLVIVTVTGLKPPNTHSGSLDSDFLTLFSILSFRFRISDWIGRVSFMSSKPIKVAIVGGGCAGMAAAFELTRPALAGQYEVTVYQLGWRLGGKGASAAAPPIASKSMAFICGRGSTKTRSA